jgi:hypothetical protein
MGLDVLPIEAEVFYKKRVDNPDPTVADYYTQLYASYQADAPNVQFQLYQLMPLASVGQGGVNLSRDTVDNAIWVALLLRASITPSDAVFQQVRQAIAGKTLNLGIVPSQTDAERDLYPGGLADPSSAPVLSYQIPSPASDGALPTNPADRVPLYQALDSSPSADLLSEPGIVQIALPADPNRLTLWNNMAPLESGVGDFPPALDDTSLDERLITWLRVTPTSGARANLLWMGINATLVTQRTHVANELLPDGTGEPDQVWTLANTPVIPATVELSVVVNGKPESWAEIDDLSAAGPEVPTPDPSLPPGAPPTPNPNINVFAVDPEAGTITTGDGTRGRRPPFGAKIRASYDYGVGAAGNVGPGTITSGPALPAGLKVTNPVRTWGGAEAETVGEGEKQIAKYLQNRDRLVNADDFATIVKRTPGVEIGRVDVLAAFNPDLSPNEPGDAPGMVTVMIIPKYDPDHPDAPVPDQTFLNTVCDYIEPRRLVTTEVALRPPTYVPIWVSVGFNVVAGQSTATVREAVKQAVLQFLSPLPVDPTGTSTAPNAAVLAGDPATGWPLRKPVVSREILAVASRVAGVSSVNDVLLAEDTQGATDQIAMTGLQLPRVAGIASTIGDPTDIAQLRGQAAPGTSTAASAPMIVPVPVIPQECQ